MPRSLALLVLAALVAAGCAATSSAPEPDGLVGRWIMETITADGIDVTAQQNPARNRYIVLYADGTFESGGQPYGRNSGRWIYRPTTNRLSLESDLGSDNDSVWTVMRRGNNAMEWRGEGSAYARRFRITARRVD